MKKTLLIICILIFNYGCSSSDDDPTSENSINPPSWIQGTWSDDSGANGFTFKKDDFCLNISLSKICNKEQLNSYNNSSVEVFSKVEQEITDSYYSLDITIFNATTSYKFKKISETEIMWLSTDKIYTKQ